MWVFGWELRKQDEKYICSLLCIPIYLIFPMVFIFPVDLSYKVPFWWTSFSTSCDERLLAMNSLSFCCSGDVFVSSSFLKKSCCLLAGCFFFSTLIVASLPLGLHCFCWEASCLQLYCSCSVSRELFFSFWFQEFPLSLALGSWTKIC